MAIHRPQPQLDAYCIAGVVHCLLFSRHMTVGVGADGVGLALKLRRYWNQRLWSRFFHVLLNVGTWSSSHEVPWEALQCDLHEFLTAHGSSSVRLVLQQLRGMLQEL